MLEKTSGNINRQDLEKLKNNERLIKGI